MPTPIQTLLDHNQWQDAVLAVSDAGRWQSWLFRRLRAEHHEDALQEARKELLGLKKRQRPKTETALVEAFGAALNRAIHSANARLRKARNHEVSEEALAWQEDGSPSSERVVVGRDLLKRIHREARQADPKMEEVLGKMAMSLTTREIAQSTGLTPKQARQKINFTRIWLKHYFGGSRFRFVNSGTIGVDLDEAPSKPYTLRHMAKNRTAETVHRGYRLEFRLEHTVEGIVARAHCRSARHIGFFIVVGGGGTVKCIATAAQPVDAIKEWSVAIPREAERVMVLATPGLVVPESERDNPDWLTAWWVQATKAMAGAVSLGMSAAEIERENPDRWEVDERVIPRLHPGLLRSGGVIPKPGERFKAALREARGYGEGQRFAEAAATYRRVLEEAIEVGDVGAEVRGTIGLWIAVRCLGFLEAADHIMLSMLSRHRMSALWTNWIAQEMSGAALKEGNLDEADRWIEHSTPEGDERTEAFYHLRKAQILLHQRRPKAAADYIAAQGKRMESLPESALQYFRMELFQIGLSDSEPTALRHELGALTDAFTQIPAPLRGARWIRSQAEALAKLGEPSEASIIEQAREQLTAWDGGLLDRWQQRDLFLAAEQLSDAGALDLLRSAFLHTDIATAGKQALIAAVRGRNSLLWASLDRFERWSLEDGQALRLLIEKATSELRVDQVGDDCRVLGEVLFPEPLTGEIWVGSDGLLTEAPLYAAHHAAHRDHPLPAFRQILGPRRAAIQTPTLQTIASLAADPADLPGAATEVTPDQADLFLRGEDVTVEALRDVRAGLVVLGVHTRHGPRGRYLHFDKPLYPDELAAMPFEGAPVVLLSGCTTAVKSLQRGVEFSFAPALLHAGVSAVLAYRWLISDEEVKTATRILLDKWPATNPALWVRDVVAELIAKGEPAHVWGGLSIY